MYINKEGTTINNEAVIFEKTWKKFVETHKNTQPKHKQPKTLMSYSFTKKMVKKNKKTEENQQKHTEKTETQDNGKSNDASQDDIMKKILPNNFIHELLNNNNEFSKKHFGLQIEAGFKNAQGNDMSEAKYIVNDLGNNYKLPEPPTINNTVEKIDPRTLPEGQDIVANFELSCVNAGKSFAIIGAPGCGKSYDTQHIILKRFKELDKKVLVLGSTNTANNNINTAKRLRRYFD